MVNDKLVRIASRGSRLALWQAYHVRDALIAADGALTVEIDVVRTLGDRILDVPLARIGDRGLFTKELDEILLADRADIAVHSLKDVPTRLPEGLEIAAISVREDPRDVLLCGDGVPAAVESLPRGARVGTSSLRRRAQLLAARSDLEVTDLRGNLDTRLRKLDEGEYDAIVLAAAGVMRLGWADRISAYLDPPRWLPAVGQGALAVVARSASPVRDRLREALHHPDTAACVGAERAFLAAVEGGCQVPVGALARMERGRLHLDALVADLDGIDVLRDADSDDASAARALGVRLANRLLERGGREVLGSIRAAADGGSPGTTGP
jgi:hydroxymethylbilane synthase